MAGFRTFATGEVLTAANVNDFLMKQSVMVFADADARTAALGANVVEGMLTYNLDTDQLEVFDGAAFVVAAPEPPAGIGSNVVYTELTTPVTTSSGTFVDITGLGVTITPSSASAKIYVMFNLSGNQNDAGAIVDRQVTATSGTSPIGGRIATFSGTGRTDFNGGGAFLHAPNTTSAVTYQVQHRALAGTTRVNATTGDSSSITVIEVAA